MGICSIPVHETILISIAKKNNIDFPNIQGVAKKAAIQIEFSGLYQTTYCIQLQTMHDYD